MAEAWFSKKHYMHLIRCYKENPHAQRPILPLLLNENGEAVAATYSGPLDANSSLARQYDDYERVVNTPGVQPVKLNIGETILPEGVAYARRKGVPATYKAIFATLANRAAAQEAMLMYIEQSGPASPTRTMTSHFNFLRLRMRQENPALVHDDVMLAKRWVHYSGPSGKTMN